MTWHSVQAMLVRILSTGAIVPQFPLINACVSTTAAFPLLELHIPAGVCSSCAHCPVPRSSGVCLCCTVMHSTLMGHLPGHC